MREVRLFEIKDSKDMFALSAKLKEDATLRLSGIDFCSLSL